MNASALFFLFIITISQNASFTLVSRARNSGSLLYNGIASIFSNGIWYFVFRQIQTMPNDEWTAAVYIGAAAIGSVLMQWVAIRFLEKKKEKVISSKDIIDQAKKDWLAHLDKTKSDNYPGLDAKKLQ